ncbi:MAG: hypothetical protein KDE27_01500, partial [Planctomycetes bacterium]|nr:hypothetical protein [Planctomycetota bacterium]
PSVVCGEVLAAAAAPRLFDRGSIEITAAPRVVATVQRVVADCGRAFAGARARLVAAADLDADSERRAAGEYGLDADGTAAFELAAPAALARPGLVWYRLAVEDGERAAASWPWPLIVPR